jgi:tetratricopeptide (TPR) repeat protein
MSAIALVAAMASALLLSGQAALGAPIVPSSDDEVIETLPQRSAGRLEERRLRQALRQRPADVGLALALAQKRLAEARETGDPRLAGMALAAIAPWAQAKDAPTPVLLMRATLQQYLHQFDESAASLQSLLARSGSAPQPQAWLTLATVRRVQGRYAESDAACASVGRAGASLHARACLAENEALRGHTAEARLTFQGLIASSPTAETQAWLGTSLAELEQRAGQAKSAERAFRAALARDADPYTVLALADFLIEQRRPTEAVSVLKPLPRSDAVLLRLAIAGKQAGTASAHADAAELRERIALANERPDAKIFHGREQAMFALLVEGDATAALALARGNVAHQREPLDLLVFAQAARASGDPRAVEEARSLTRQLGLVDQRIEATL